MKRRDQTWAPGRWLADNLSLTQRAIGFLVLLVLSVGGLLAAAFVVTSSRVFTDDLEQRGQATATGIAKNVKLGVLVRDRLLLEQTLRPYLQDPDVSYISILDPSGQVIASLPETVKEQEIDAIVASTVQQARGSVVLQHAENSAEATDILGAGMHIGAPIWRDLLANDSDDLFDEDLMVDAEPTETAGTTQQELIGVVHLGVTTERVHGSINDLIKQASLYAGVLALLGLVVAAWLLKRWLKPLQMVTSLARRARFGGLQKELDDEITRALLKNSERNSHDELRILQSAFADMIHELRLHYKLQEEQKERLEQMVVERTMELTHAKEEAEAASIAKSRFLASMSHELRTPLNAVIGFSEMLQRDMTVTPEQTKEYLGYICDSGKHLLDIINDILDLSKLEAGRFELQFNDAYLDKIVQEAVSFSQPLMDRKNQKLQINVPPLEITTDPRILKQVIINLVSNAVKFTPAEGSISIEATELGDQFELKVADTGIGMSDQEIELAMQPFAQVSEQMYVQTEGEGTGLGLPLVEHFMLLMKGGMRIESEKGKGTTVTLTVPIHPVQPDVHHPEEDFDYI
ncbi:MULTISPECIES: sensor histidine kinase [Kordiimonas]|jgi:signal transduction histidine kinase|uniref:sensor histidine kinase n=1 Tax=Kordiimonas TaxID=288021 RepID=UPI002580D33C|nr:ATP-binding protein [Kordiimonas sp. UBA4487]